MAMRGRVVKYSSSSRGRDAEASSSALPLLSGLCFSLPLLLPHRVATAIYKRKKRNKRFRAKNSVTVSSHGGGDKKGSAASMSIMAWYPLPQSGGTPSVPGDEFFDDQLSAGWPLWSFGSSADDDHDNHGAGGARAEKHGNDDDAGSSDQHTEGLLAVPQQRTQPTDDIFMSQFSDEEMRRMDAPFEALDMFPGSMHRLLSYENMLSGVLTGSSSEDRQDATLGLGVDTMDTCGFPLFSHDLMQNAPTELVVPDLVTPKDHHQDGASFTTKRSRSVAADEGSVFFEALVLQELEDVVFQLTKRTRVCLRDAFFRLAESSRAKCSAANETPSSETGVHQAADGNASRISTPGCPERETNAIDRTVADLTMKPPRLVSRCPDDDSGAEAQSATNRTTTA